MAFPVALDLGWGHCSHSPCRASGVTLSEVPALCPWGFPGWRGPSCSLSRPSLEGSRASSFPPSQKLEQKTRVQKCCSGRGDFTQVRKRGLFPQGCLACELGSQLSGHCPGSQDFSTLFKASSDPHPGPRTLINPFFTWATVCTRLTSGFFLVF